MTMVRLPTYNYNKLVQIVGVIHKLCGKAVQADQPDQRKELPDYMRSLILQVRACLGVYPPPGPGSCSLAQRSSHRGAVCVVDPFLLLCPTASGY